MIKRILAWCVEPTDVRDVVGCLPLIGLVAALWLCIALALVAVLFVRAAA